MTVAVNTLADRVRRAIRDYPAYDTLYTSMDTPDVAIPVNNPTAGYTVSKTVVVDQESMLVTGTASAQGAGATFAVDRGWSGTSPQVHQAGTPVLINPRFGPQTILDMMNEGVRALWPYFFQWIEDHSTFTTSDLQMDYALPAAFGEQGIVTSMEILLPGLYNAGWKRFRWFKHLEGSTRTVALLRIPPVGTQLRMIGVAPFTSDLAYGSSTPSNMLDQCAVAIVKYARYLAKLADEGQRTNISGAQNIGPAAVPAGANTALAMQYLQDFERYCVQTAQRQPLWQTRRRM